MIYERQGRLADAVVKMETVKKYNPLDVGVAFQLGLCTCAKAIRFGPARVGTRYAVDAKLFQRSLVFSRYL